MTEENPVQKAIDQADARLRAAGWTQEEIDLVTTSKAILRAARDLNPRWAPPGPRNEIVADVIGRQVPEEESESAWALNQLLGFLEYISEDPRH